MTNYKTYKNGKYIVFVDFDGVLTTARQHFAQPTPPQSYEIWATFDPVTMEFFNKIHNTFEDVKFVWTTSWRNNVVEGLMLNHILYSMWYNAGFRGHFGEPWRVNPDCVTSLYSLRATEIADYLEKYTDCDDYIIFDDTDYNFNNVLQKKRFIKTDPDNGLLFKQMKNAWSIMGQWERK